MRTPDFVFYLIGFFLLGILVASLKINISIAILWTALIAILFLFVGYLKNSPKLFWFSGLSLFIMLGAFYYFWWTQNQIQSINIVFNKKINFEGLVIDNPERGNQQKLTIALQPPYQGKVLIKLKSYPNFDYGDLIKFEGEIKKPEPENYANYLAKDGVFGVANFPKSELIAKNQGSVIKSFLFKFKESIVVNFQKTLAPEKSAFLAGITLGERAEFSKELKSAMSQSGTTHLVALSGYNISIIVIAMFGFFNYFLSRRSTFILTTLMILGFILMVGAEASVVRAGIMGFIALLAKEVGRLYSVRNAIILAAFFMVLANPRILYFDIGFQLSFLALLGLIYLMPALQKFFKISANSSFLSLKENFLTTLSAQLAVAPILIVNFNNFSLIALLANLLVLTIIPLTMTLGFILGGLGFLSSYLSLIWSWFLNIILSYELWVIKFFGALNIFRFEKINILIIFLYYIVLIAFVWYHLFYKRRSNELDQRLTAKTACHQISQ